MQTNDIVALQLSRAPRERRRWFTRQYLRAYGRAAAVALLQEVRRVRREVRHGQA